MNEAGESLDSLPDSVRETLEEFSVQFDLDLHIWSLGEDGSRTAQLYPALENGASAGIRDPSPDSVLRCLSAKGGPPLQLEIRSLDGLAVEEVASFIQSGVERVLDLRQEGSSTSWTSCCQTRRSFTIFPVGSPTTLLGDRWTSR